MVIHNFRTMDRNRISAAGHVWKRRVGSYQKLRTDLSVTKQSLTLSWVEAVSLYKMNTVTKLKMKANDGLDLVYRPQGQQYNPQYTGCNRRNVRDFGRVFLMLKYTDITQNTYIQSWTVMEIMAFEMCGLLGCRHTVGCRRTERRLWHHTCPLHSPGYETC